MQIKSSTKEFDCCNFSALCVQRALSSSRVKERHKYSLLHVFPSTLFRNVISDLAEPPSSRPPVSFLFGFCLRKKNPITFCFPTWRLSPCFRRFRLIVFCCCYRVSNPPPPPPPTCLVFTSLSSSICLQSLLFPPAGILFIGCGGEVKTGCQNERRTFENNIP